MQSLIQWFAVHARSRHEFQVSERLELAGVEKFLPHVCRTSIWSDRKKNVRLPLFPGYLFVRLRNSHQEFLKVLNTKGVVSILGPVPGVYEPVPDEHISSLKTLVNSRIPLDPYPYLKEGQRVRIKSGPLAGIEGILADKTGRQMLVLSIDILRQSTSVAIDAAAVEAI